MRFRMSAMPMLVAGLGSVTPVIAQDRALASPPLGGAMPVDSAVTLGTLPNGLHYYVRANHQATGQATLLLVVRAGSVLESEDQRGFAHVIAHMAFAGTRSIPKAKLVEYLETVGASPDPDRSAYTNYDETLYRLQIPTETKLFTRGVEILADWARNQMFDPAEIERVRRVVLEEQRLARNAWRNARAKSDEQIRSLIYQGSRYAERFPLGTEESLEHVAPDALQRFYRDSYRPDRMAVIAVGDFDSKAVEQLIRTHFMSVPAEKNVAMYPQYNVTFGDSLRAVNAIDPELVGPHLTLSWYRPRTGLGTVEDFRASLLTQLCASMLGDRLAVLVQRPDQPFLRASMNSRSIVPTVDLLTLNIDVSDTGVSRGLRAALAELGEIGSRGFEASELERARHGVERTLEHRLRERDKGESTTLALAYRTHFLFGVAIPSSDQAYMLGRALLAGVTLEEITQVARRWLNTKNRLLLATAPARAGVIVPSQDSLAALLESTWYKSSDASERHTNSE